MRGNEDIQIMRKTLFILILACLAADSLYAQPAARRKEQQEQQQKSNATSVTTRSQVSFPVAETMSEDVVWRRDIYRRLDLTKDANAGLYYPIEAVGSQMNLFTYIFKLMMTGQVKVYEYRMDGNELFSDSARVKPLTFLDNYHIYYERVNGRIKLDNSDIPSREVRSYYIKEAVYYDQNNAAFHTKVLALCPIMSREDDFGDAATQYPLFWVRYEDLAPFLTKQTMMTSNLNNAATMSVDDFFTKNMYKGDIYKTNNMLGLTIDQYCPTDSAKTKEQKRIEAELETFEKGLWGKIEQTDTTDSIAKTEAEKSKKKSKKNRRSTGSSSTKTAKTKTTSSSGNSAARVSVRRERH